MWNSSGKLPHVLSPHCYYDEAFHARERAALFARGWHCVTTRVVLREDDAMFGAIQRSLQASEHAGVLGARAECVHAFQRYVADRCGICLVHSERESVSTE